MKQQKKIVPAADASYKSLKLEYTASSSTTELTRRDHDNAQQKIRDAEDAMAKAGLSE